MRHAIWWCRWLLLFNHMCARCLLRRLTYGYRLDPVGYMAERNRVWRDNRLSPADRMWILSRAKAIEIEYD